MPLDRATLHTWLHHWQDEYDAAYLYLVLAGQEPDPKRKYVYIKLAGVEERHVQKWDDLLADHGHRVGRPRPSLNARLRAWVGRRFGPNYLLPLLLREEGQEVKGYMDLHKEVSFDDAREVSLKLAKESAAHAETLAGLAGRAAEPWHKTGSGGFLRNVVYGFNDGLTANFGLVAGVIGADVAPHIVLVSGIAGMFADALSMGASGYLAAKSEQEVYDHEIAMEKEEIRTMPEVVQEERALVYQTKLIQPGIARKMAAEASRDTRRWRRLPGRRRGGEGLLDDEVQQAILHVDRLPNRLPIHELPHRLVLHSALDDLRLARPPDDRHSSAHLSVHLHDHFHVPRDGE